MKTLIDKDATQNDMPTILQDLSGKSQGSAGGEGRKGGERRRKAQKMLRTKTIVTLN